MRGNRQAGKTWFFTFTDVTLSSSLKCEHERIHFWWIISDGKSWCSCWLFMTFRENTLLLRLLIKTCQKLWGCCALFFYLPSVLYAIVLLYSVSLCQQFQQFFVFIWSEFRSVSEFIFLNFHSFQGRQLTSLVFFQPFPVTNKPKHDDTEAKWALFAHQ